jgi:hypothetical protein
MTTFAQGQPFNSGPVWDQMRFGSEQTTGTMPLTGSYMDVFNMLTQPEIAETFGKLPKDIQGFAPLMLMVGAQGADAQRAADARQERLFQYQREASERANEMGIKNQIIGSFLKDVPAALNFRDRNKYLPEQIAAANATRPIPSYGPTNYYGFVR